LRAGWRWGPVGAAPVAAVGILLVAAFALPGRVAADSGGSYDLPVVAQGPTIDGSIGAIEWSGAKTFPVMFGNLAGTAYVERTASNLYFALVVNDTATGDSAVYFDNNDDGVVAPGEDLMAKDDGQPGTDWYVFDTGFSWSVDTSAGGTNDVVAAQTFTNVVSFEYQKPLCSADSAHDFCFLPPATESSPPTKLGFTIGYRNQAGASFLI